MPPTPSISHLTPQKAWDSLQNYRSEYYDSLSAMYSGDHELLRETGETHTFWQRDRCNCRIHVPISADIAATSSDLLFSQPPKLSAFRQGEEQTDATELTRLQAILDANNYASKLNEAAETASALGDVYIKLRWDNRSPQPLLDIVQPDAAWSEYFLGDLTCVHFFTPIVTDYKSGRITRVYECYTRGHIDMSIFHGDATQLGTQGSESELKTFGFSQASINTPTDELYAVHIANIRPNRHWRATMLGRSDLDGLRDLCDALDESYSSWIRDIRLGKAKTIVPMEYLRRKPNEMLEGIAQKASWEFDPDIETYVAMDIDTEKSGGGITTQQPDIRAADHASTCTELVRNILTLAGYSPQTFGLDISGSSDSGKALEIREHKSFTTRNKKRTYWKQSLERILTALEHLDAALYPSAGSASDIDIHISFPDVSGVDQQTLAQTVELLQRAKSASLDARLAILHPDWPQTQRDEEADKCRQEFAVDLESPLPDIQLGDAEAPPPEDETA